MVTMMMMDDEGEIVFSGKHLKGESDGKWTYFTGYDPHFENYKINKLRTSKHTMVYSL